MTTTAISFSSIRPLNGSQSEAFEELCIHLSGGIVDESISAVERIRGAGGDGGVEAIITTASGKKIGIQAKYFLANLGAVQWRQIDKSVSTAASNYKKLTRYIVCCPTNRTPSGLKKWDSQIAGWKAKYPKLTIEWKGATEVTALLAKPEWSHLATYWFGAPSFDLAWTARCSRTAIEQLHQRYTPRLHRRTHAENDLRLICAIADQRATYREACSKVARLWRELLRDYDSKAVTTELANATVGAIALMRSAAPILVGSLCEGDLLQQDPDLLDKAIESAFVSIGAMAKAVRSAAPVKSAASREADYENRHVLEKLSELRHVIEHVKELFDRYQDGRAQQCLVVGDAGSGKSHLLATLVGDLLQEKRACLFLIGERFQEVGDIREQICSLLGWSHSFRALCECMDAHAKAVGNTSVFVIDAINESPARSRWQADLISLISAVSEFSNIQVVISCRSDWVAACLPHGLAERLTRVNHRGFDMRFAEAVAAYFDGYRVTSPQYPPLLPEFRNPLFLKTVCEAYEGRMLPLEPLSFLRVMDEWEARLAAKIESAIDCPTSSVKAAVAEIIAAIAGAGGRTLSESRVIGICRQQFPDARLSHSLYRHLCSNGLLQDVNLPSGTVVRMQYERFSDIRIAEVELRSIGDRRAWMEYWRERVVPSLVDGTFIKEEAVARLAAYALILPERVGVELVECPIASALSAGYVRGHLKQLMWESWVRALPWRRIAENEATIVHYFVDYVLPHVSDELAWEQLFLLSCIAGHPLNATFVHRNLLRRELNEREALFTIPLATLEIEPESGTFLAEFLQWSAGAATRSTDDQAYLCAVMLVWLTSSTNTELRDRATALAIAVLTRRADPLIRILNELKAVNDPYVVERLLAVAAGVVPSLRKADVGRVATLIMDWFFVTGAVPPHLLQREYAKFVVDFAVAFDALPRSALKAATPPFGLKMPQLWSDAQVDVYDKDSAYSSIASSLRPEGMGMYGDFGRYEMGSAVRDFTDPTAHNPKGRTTYERYPRHDARLTRRYIWQRVIELGWSPQRYIGYERSLSYFSRERPKIERIGKKYQWIGLHEYLGYLSDTHLFVKWNDTPEQLQGAWQTYQRDFDPSTVPWTVRPAGGSSPTEFVPEAPSPLPSVTETAQRQAWVQAAYASFAPYLTTTIDDARWVVLYSHHSFDEVASFGLERFKTDLMDQWIDIRAFMLPRRGAKQGLERLSKVSLFGDGVDVPHTYKSWVSEYPWHPMLAELDACCTQNDTWVDKAGLQCFLLACQIGGEQKNFHVPPPTLHSMMSAVLGATLSPLRSGGPLGYQIEDASGKAVFIGSYGEQSRLLVRQDALMALLGAVEGTLAWGILSEKSAYDGHAHIGGMSSQSAVYWMEVGGNIKGGLSVHESTLPETDNETKPTRKKATTKPKLPRKTTVVKAIPSKANATAKGFRAKTVAAKKKSVKPGSKSKIKSKKKS